MFLLKSKTLWFSYLLTAFSLVEMKFDLISSLIPVKYTGLSLLTISILVALLRVATTKPLTEK